MARIRFQKETPLAKLSALIAIALLSNACGHLVTPDANAIEPAQRTARLEELHRVQEVKDLESDVSSLVRWVSKTVYGAEARDLDPIVQEILAQGERHDLDPLLIASVIATESYYHAEVISYAGAVGLMQVIPYVGKDVALRNDIAWQGWETLLQPQENIAIGTTYLRELLDMFDGNTRMALAAYNMGPSLLKQRLKTGFQLTGPYVTKVMATYSQFRRAAISEAHLAHITSS